MPIYVIPGLFDARLYRALSPIDFVLWSHCRSVFLKMAIFEAIILCVRVRGIDTRQCQFLKITVSNTRVLAKNIHVCHDKSTFSHNWTKFIRMHGTHNVGFYSHGF